MRPVAIAGCIAFLMTAAAVPAAAQEAGRETRASMEVITGVMSYDLSGTGTTMPLAVRASRPLTDHLALEFGTTLASPDQQFGRSTFTAPEVQLSYSWQVGRFRPFVSGGGGFAVTQRESLSTRWQRSLSAGGGTRFDLTDNLYAIGEMRLRGLSRNFSASTAEWLGGIGWRFR